MNAAAMTPKQIEQLDVLIEANAIDQASAIGPYNGKPFNPMVLGKLRDMGLADSKVLRPAGGSQQTVYWVTPAGQTRAAAR